MKPRAAAWLVSAAGALAVLAPARAGADEPLWELGAGLAAVRLPHYRGSDQSRSWLLPLPYAVYRGEIFRADRDGARAVLLDRAGVDLDVSAAATAPTRSRDDRARAGMPDLAPTLELGPNLNLTLARGAAWQLQLRLPVRAVFTAQRSPQAIGATFSPVLNLDLRAAGWNLGLQGGPLAATRAYHAYFYDVAPAYASADRPAYRAGGGAGGWHLGASASRRFGAWWLGAYARADSVAGAAFEPSPLVRQRGNLSLGLALSRILAVSDERVADRR
ncbi:MAG: MipA/OmpV family protein [Burkholderiales bacterium]|nr:MipA/OmpV family protein [Burkholderiales bacterium]